MIEIVDMENPPLRLLLGKTAITRYQAKLNAELTNLETIRHFAGRGRLQRLVATVL